MPYADIGGYSMHYELDNFTDPWTKPETILLHHGYLRNGRFWYSWVPALARHYQVLRPDARGCGQSPSPGPDFMPSLEGFVNDVLALLESLGIDKVHFVGESFGGIVGLQLAHSHPSAVSSLTLCNTPSRLQSTMKSDYSSGHGDFETAMDAMGVEEWCQSTVHVRLDQERASPELTQWYCHEMGHFDITLAKRWLAFQPALDLGPYLAELKVPTLVLAPGKSRITDPEQQRIIAATIPDAEIVIFENVGHGLSILEPEGCTQALIDFLVRHPTRRT